MVQMTIEQRVKAFRAKLEAEREDPKPKPTEREKAQRLQEQLHRTELALGKTDHRRIMLLSRALQVAARQEDYTAVYGYASEIALLSRTRVLGVQGAHPVMSTLPPGPRGMSSLPAPMDIEVDSEPQG